MTDNETDTKPVLRRSHKRREAEDAKSEPKPEQKPYEQYVEQVKKAFEIQAQYNQQCKKIRSIETVLRESLGKETRKLRRRTRKFDQDSAEVKQVTARLDYLEGLLEGSE